MAGIGPVLASSTYRIYSLCGITQALLRSNNRHHQSVHSYWSFYWEMAKPLVGMAQEVIGQPTMQLDAPGRHPKLSSFRVLTHCVRRTGRTMCTNFSMPWSVHALSFAGSHSVHFTLSRSSRSICFLTAAETRCFARYTLATLTPSDLATSPAGHCLSTFRSKI